MEITVSVEEERGCGFRKSGPGGVGYYLMGGDVSAPCGRLPIPLEICPCCGGGIKQTRGWTWIEPVRLFEKAPACKGKAEDAPVNARSLPVYDCRTCPVGDAAPEGKHGLIWVGGRHYPTAAEFTREAARMGISRRLSNIPKDLKIGETWVYFAHPKAVLLGTDAEGKEIRGPGIFTAFKPTHVDLVVDDEKAEIPERAERAIKKLGEENVRVVKVVPKRAEQGELEV